MSVKHRSNRATWLHFSLQTFWLIFILLGLGTGILVNAYIDTSRSTLTRFSQSKAEQIAAHLDSVVENAFSYIYTIYNDQKIFQWMFATQTDPYLDIDMMLAAKRYVSHETYINDIYLFNLQTGRLYSTLDGASTVDMPSNPVLLAAAQDRGSGLVSLRRFHQDTNTSYLAFMYPMALIPRDYCGRIILLLDPEAIETNVLGISSSEEQIYVLDAGGEIILGEAPEDYAKLSRSDETDVLTSKWHGKNTLVTALELTQQPWTVYHVMRVEPIHGLGSSFLRWIIMTLSTVSVLLALILLFKSKKMLAPFDMLAGRLQQIIPGSDIAGIDDPATLLQESVDYLQRNIDGMRKTLRQHSQTIRAKEWQRWLMTGSMPAMPTESPVILVLMRIENYEELKSRETYSSRMLIKGRIEALTLQLLSETFTCADCVDIGDDHLCFLLSPPTEDARSLETLLQATRNEAVRDCGISLALAISEPLTVGTCDAPQVCSQLYQATFLHFFTGESRICTPADLAAWHQAALPFPNSETLERLVDALRRTPNTFWEDCFDSLTSTWQSMCYEDVRLLALLTAHSLVSAYHKYLDENSFATLRTDINQATRLNDVLDILRSVCCKIYAKNHEPASGMSIHWQDTLMDVVSYIDGHMQDPALCADQIAAQAGVSTNYLRRMFKMCYNESMSNYIRNRRMDEAMNLLRSTTLPIADIMQRVGFATRSNFFQSFKKQTNLTPEQYRQEFGN